MSTLLKRFLILFFLLTSILITPLIVKTYAADFTNSDYDTSVDPSMHNASQGVVIEALNSISCIVGGYDFIKKSNQCLSVMPSGKLGYSGQPTQGLLPIASGMITVLYTPPAHLSDYAQYLSANFIKNKNVAYAQTTGVGYNSLNPLSSVWTTFRNITYLIFIVLFVLVGLGIMLRFKLDPRTAMTIENSLPKLVLAMVLVTFSYAIAGFLIDLMYVFTYLVITVMSSADPLKGAAGIDIPKIVGALNQPPLSFVSVIFGDANGNGGIFTLVGNMSYAVSQTISSILRDFFTSGNAAGSLIAGVLGFFNVSCWAHEVFPWSVDFAACGVNGVAEIAGMLMWIVGMVTIFIILIRVWWTLLKTYVTILLDIIMGPFMIALGIIPGSKINFASWIQDLVANLAVFPAVIFIFLLAKIFGDTLTQGTGMFVTPLTGNISSTDKGLQETFKAGQPNATYLGYIIAFALIIITPQLIEQLKTSLKAGKNNYGTAIGAALVVGSGAFSKATSPIWRSGNINGENEGYGRRVGHGIANVFGKGGYKAGYNQQPTWSRKAQQFFTGKASQKTK